MYFDFLTREKEGRRRMTHKPNQDNVLQLFYLFEFMTYCTLLKYIRYVSPELQVCCSLVNVVLGPVFQITWAAQVIIKNFVSSTR